MSTSGPFEFAGTPRFAVDLKLGAGGMGVVYLAHDRDRNVRVALKVLPHLDPGALSRFKREFRALAEIVHPNLIELYELVGDHDQWFFTMEAIEGVGFTAWVRRGGTVDFDRLRITLRQLTRGVQAVHDAGRLHRDLKPPNVMVRIDGSVVILDFGLVSELGVRPVEAEITGTAAYMAPEQWSGEPLTAASDWYAIGVMVYEALTGTQPFPGKPTDALLAKLSGDAPAPSVVAQGIPQDLDALCVELLRRDPAQRPTSDQILARLGQTAEQASIPQRRVEEPIELVGRERQLAALAEGFGAVRNGTTIVAHVQGPSGTGKSALVDHFLATLQGRPDTVVLRGRCYEQESVPYKALDSLVDALAEHLRALVDAEVQQLIPVQAAVLARVFPVLQRLSAIAQAPSGSHRGSDPRELRRAAVSALREMLTRIGQRSNLVLAIDDLQWGDLDSAMVLGDLLAPPDPPRLMLLLAYRSEYVDRNPGLKALHEGRPAADPWQQRIDVPITPLSLTESEVLAHRLLAPNSVAEFANANRVARESGGNPYFIYELSRHVDVPDRATGGADGPVELDAVLWSRVQRLPATAQELLALVAVAGQPIALRHLLAITPHSPDVMHALARLKSEHFVRGTGTQLEDYLETYHDRVRESVVARLAGDVTSRHHANLARSYEAAGNIDPETIAEHFEHAGESAKAGEYYAAAASTAASSLAFDRAATLYRRALQGRTLARPEHTRLRRELGHALANAGRGYEAAQAYEAAVTSAEPGEHFELERLAASQYCFSGHIREGRVIFRRLLARVGLTLPSNPVRIVASLLSRRGRLRLRGVKHRERREAEVPPEALRRIDLLWSLVTGLSVPDALGVASLQTKGLLLALEAGEPYRVARALAFEAFMTSVDGSHATKRTQDLMDRAEALATRIDHPHALGVVQLMKAMVALNQTRFADVVVRGAEAIETLRTRCSGVSWELSTSRTVVMWSHYQQGNCEELRRVTPGILSDAIDRGDLFLVTNIRSVITSFLLLVDDAPDAAIREVGEALAPWPREGFNLQHANEMFSETNALIYRGRGIEALESVDRRWSALRRSLQLQTQLVWINMTDLRARACLAAAEQSPDRVRLLARAERHGRRLVREGIEMSTAFGHCILAGVASLRGKPGEAAEHLRQAVIDADAIHDGFRATFARWRLAAVLAGDEGAACRAEAEAALARQQVKNPKALASVYLPGFPVS